MKHFSRPALASLFALAAALGPARAQLPAPSIYEGISPMASCTTLDPPAIACLKLFPKTPSSKRVLIRNVSCYISSTARLDLLLLGVAATSGGATIKKVYVPFQGEFRSNTYFYTINQPVYFYIGNDRYPELILSFSTYGNSSADCSIAGEYVQ